MKQITLFFAVHVLRRKSGVYIFWKYFKETINGILKKGKTLRERETERQRERVLKDICLWNTLF